MTGYARSENKFRFTWGKTAQLLVYYQSFQKQFTLLPDHINKFF